MREYEEIVEFMKNYPSDEDDHPDEHATEAFFSEDTLTVGILMEKFKELTEHDSSIISAPIQLEIRNKDDDDYKKFGWHQEYFRTDYLKIFYEGHRKGDYWIPAVKIIYDKDMDD